MKAQRYLERALLFAGLVAVGIWAWSEAASAVYQAAESRIFDRELSAHEPPPEAGSPARAAAGQLVGRLTIPRLGVSAMVREGDDENTLRMALGHIPGTALPGHTGNVGIAGHRDTLFRGLRAIRKNDLILFETLAGEYRYRVGATEIVNPDDVGVLAANGGADLTLVTCYPFSYIGSAPDRFIVKARLASSNAGGIQPDAGRPAYRK